MNTSEQPFAEIAQPFEGQVVAAREVGREHHGWLAEYPLQPDPGATLPGPSRRTITIIGVRRWVYDDVERVGIVSDDSNPLWRGTEYHLTGDTPVQLLRQVKRGVPRARKNDYPQEVRRG